MSLESSLNNQPFAVRRVVLASGWCQGLMLFSLASLPGSVSNDFTKMTVTEKTVFVLAAGAML